MKISICSGTAALGLAVLAISFPSAATAGCGAGSAFHAVIAPNLHLMAAQSGPDDNGGSASIVGMWKAQFTSKGMSTVPVGELPPNTVFEWGYAQWHSDGTEFFNSGDRQPTSQNFCMGVWQQTGPGTYSLNHFAYNYDPTTSELIGKVNIREQVTLDRTGNQYTGTFTIMGWNATGTQIINIAGTLEAVRVTINTVDTSIP